MNCISKYVKVAAESLKNFLHLLDGWFVYKGRQLSQEQPFEVHLHPHVNVDIADVSLRADER